VLLCRTVVRSYRQRRHRYSTCGCVPTRPRYLFPVQSTEHIYCLFKNTGLLRRPAIRLPPYRYMIVREVEEKKQACNLISRNNTSTQYLACLLVARGAPGHTPTSLHNLNL